MSENTETTEGTPTTEAKVKPPKVKKEKAPPKPNPVKVVETAEQVLKRLKKSPDTAARYARVTEILELGKGGSPTRVRIKTDDKDSEGRVQFRDIKPQDLFQVKLSVAGQAAEAKKKRNIAASARRKTSGKSEATKA